MPANANSFSSNTFNCATWKLDLNHRLSPLTAAALTAVQKTIGTVGKKNCVGFIPDAVPEEFLVGVGLYSNAVISRICCCQRLWITAWHVFIYSFQLFFMERGNTWCRGLVRNPPPPRLLVKESSVWADIIDATTGLGALLSSTVATAVPQHETVITRGWRCRKASLGRGRGGGAIFSELVQLACKMNSSCALACCPEVERQNIFSFFFSGVDRKSVV